MSRSCPFHDEGGGESLILFRTLIFNKAFIKCKVCGSRGPLTLGSDSDAWDAWNTRPDSSSTRLQDGSVVYHE